MYQHYKGKGPQCEPANYRSIMLANCSAKQWHGLLKDMTMQPAMQHVLTSGQFGGLPGLSTAVPVQTTRLFVSYCRARNRPAAIVFLDVVAAYYSVIRQIVTGFDHNFHEADLVKVMCSLQLPSSVFPLVLANIRQPAVDRMHITAHHNWLLSEVMQDTWFTTRNDPGVVQTTKGTRPGDNLAGLLFDVLLGPSLQCIHDRLVAAGLVEPMPSAPGSGGIWSSTPAEQSYVSHVVWADDAAFMLTAGDNQQLVQKVKKLTEIVIDGFAGVGLRTNLQPGKTEAIMCFRAKQAHLARQQMHVYNDSQLEVVTQAGAKQILTISFGYVRLGTYFSDKGSMTPELKRRVAMAAAEIRPLRKHLLGNKDLRLQTRSCIAQSLVASKMFYNCATWPLLKTGEARILHTALMRMHRSVTGLVTTADDHQHYTDRTVLVAADGLTAAETCRMRRLKHYAVLLRIADRVQGLWDLINLEHACATDSWMSQVLLDIQWLWHRMHTTEPMPMPTEVAAWEDFIRTYPGNWKHLVDRAFRSHKQQRKNEDRVATWQRAFTELLDLAGMRVQVPQPLSDAHLAPLSTIWQCHLCPQGFPTLQRLSAHSFGSTGYVRL